MLEGQSRIQIVFSGGMADLHMLDGREMGHALLGATRVYTMASHAIITGKVLGKKSTPAVRCYIGTPYAGSVGSDIIIDVVQSSIAAGALYIPATSIKSTFDFLLEKIMRALSKVWADDKKGSEAEMQVIQQLAAQSHEITQMLTAGILKNNNDLTAALIRMAESTRPSAKEMLTPVGNSCLTETHTFDASPDKPQLLYDAPVAAALRGESDSVGEITTYTAYVAAVDTINQTAKFELEGIPDPIRGTIGDPSLSMARNAYTHALDTRRRLQIIAKPIFNVSGEIKSIVVMDAKVVCEP